MSNSKFQSHILMNRGRAYNAKILRARNSWLLFAGSRIWTPPLKTISAKRYIYLKNIFYRICSFQGPTISLIFNLYSKNIPKKFSLGEPGGGNVCAPDVVWSRYSLANTVNVKFTKMLSKLFTLYRCSKRGSNTNFKVLKSQCSKFFI